MEGNVSGTTGSLRKSCKRDVQKRYNILPFGITTTCKTSKVKLGIVIYAKTRPELITSIIETVNLLDKYSQDNESDL